MGEEAGRHERADARANRARVLVAAREAFREHGVAAEIKDLAERAEVGVGTIYRNFPGGKEDLVLAILKDLLAVSLDDVREAEAMADPVAGLRYLLERELTRVEQYGWLFEALLSGQIPPRCRAVMREDMEAHQFGLRFERLVACAVQRGRLRPDLDVAAASAMLNGTTSPMNRFALPDRTPQGLAEATLEVFLRGAAVPKRKLMRVKMKGEVAEVHRDN